MNLYLQKQVPVSCLQHRYIVRSLVTKYNDYKMHFSSCTWTILSTSKWFITLNIHSTQCRFNIILHNHNHQCSLHTELHIHSFIHNYNNLKSINLNIFSEPIHINLYVYNFWVKNKFKHVIRYHLHYCQGFWVHFIQNCEQGWKKTLGYNC